MIMPPCAVQLDPVAVAPDAGKALEVGGAILAPVAVVPEADRHRRKRRGADELAFFARAPAGPSSSNTSTSMPSAAAWISPRHTGRVRIAADEAADDVGAAGDRGQVHVALDRVVDVSKLSGASGEPVDVIVRTDRRAMRAPRAGGRPSARASMNFADVPNSVMLVCVGEIEKPRCRRDERRAVVEHERRPRRQRRSPASSTSSSRRS